MTLIARGMGAKYRAARFTPLGLKSANCVLWLDMLERNSWSLTSPASAIPSLRCVDSIVNLASGVTWSEPSQPPFYEPTGLGGRPCMINPRGHGRRIISTDPLPLTAVNGDDQACTILLALESNHTAGEIGYALSNAISTHDLQSKQDFGVHGGRYRLVRFDNTGAAAGNTFPALAQRGPHVVAVRVGLSLFDFWLDHDDAALYSVPGVGNIGSIAADRTALFLRPDLNFSEVFLGRIGAAVMWAGLLSDADLLAARMWMVSRWLSPVHKPNKSSPGPTVWLDEKVGTSGNDVTEWSARGSTAVPFLAPAGKEPSVDGSYSGSPIDFTPGSSDCLVSDAAVAAGAITIGLKFKLDSLPPVGSYFCLASPRLGTDKWFHIFLINQISGWLDVSFGYQPSPASAPHFGIAEENAGALLDGGVHRLIITYDGSGASPSDYRVWLDGVERTVAAAGNKNRTAGERGSLGAQVLAGDTPYQILDGKLFKPTIFDRVLSATEIAQLDSYLADGYAFSPEILPGCVLHLDMQDADSYIVTPGSPDTVRNIRNKASQVLWTEATNPPQYEAAGLNGRPCIKGDGAARRLLSTEAAVVAAAAGDDKPFSVYAVFQPGNVDADHMLFGWASSAHANARQLGVGQSSASNGRYSLVKLDDAAAGAENTVASPAVQPQPQVISWVGTTAAQLMLNDGPRISSGNTNFGVVTPTRAGLFCRPQSAIDRFSSARLGELIVFAGEHSEAEQRAVARYLMADWGIAFNPAVVPGLVAWFDMSEASSYVVTPGSPDTVTSIKNLVSNTAWNTAISSFPRYESSGINGRPSMRINGGADLRGLVSTESAVVSAFSGNDPSTTVVAVVEPMFNSSMAVLGVAHSGFTSANRSQYFGTEQSNGGRIAMIKVDDTGFVDSSAPAAHPIPLLQPHVMTWRTSGIAMALYVNRLLAHSDPSVDTGVFTPDRVSIGTRPASNISLAMFGRIAEILVFNRALTDLELSRVWSSLMTKWGIT